MLLAGCAPTGKSAPADVELRALQRLDAAWMGEGRESRPASRPVRFALPIGWGFLMQNCMNESGFPAFAYSRTDGFTNGLNRASSVGREGLAWYRCSQDFPEFDTVYSELDEQRLDELYDYYVTWLIPCLAAAGAPVGDVPTREEFGNGGDGQPGWWNPFESSERPASIEALDLQFAKCPPYPDSEPQLLP